MNDRYLFKAKRIDNGEWVVGSYVYTFAPDKECPVVGLMKSNHFIVEENGYMCIVDPSTICRCTGLPDKNGTLMIWENDICDYDDRAKFVVKFGTYNEFADKRHIGFYAKWEDRWDGLYRGDLGYLSDKVKVIGSIIDNPELLEVE